MAQNEDMSTETHLGSENHSDHPTPLTYFKVAMILSIITAIEVGIFYVEDLSYGIIPILTILSVMKFALVIMFYMHLRYDNRLFSTLFLTGLALAFLVVIALLALFQFFTPS
jgi:cytochrome c oxidase subunit 4|tara:strand:- start:3493 stop:3828 length:336 start_codon:yes stop_codon:yes gene_type:complete